MDSPGTQMAPEAKPEASIARAIIARQRLSELGLVILIAVVPLILNAFSALVYPGAVRWSAINLAMNLAMTSALLHQISSLLLVFYLLSRRGAGPGTLGLVSVRWTDVPK